MPRDAGMRRVAGHEPIEPARFRRPRFRAPRDRRRDPSCPSFSRIVQWSGQQSTGARYRATRGASARTARRRASARRVLVFTVPSGHPAARRSRLGQVVPVGQDDDGAFVGGHVPSAVWRTARVSSRRRQLRHRGGPRAPDDRARWRARSRHRRPPRPPPTADRGRRERIVAGRRPAARSRSTVRLRAIACSQAAANPAPSRTSRPGPTARGTSPAPPLPQHLDPTSTGGPPRRPHRRTDRRGRPARHATRPRPLERGRRRRASPVGTRLGTSALGRGFAGLPRPRAAARSGSEPAGRCASRQVTPSGPTIASWLVPAGRSSRSPASSATASPRRQAEPDRAGGHDEDLVVAVLVRAVPVARAVRPGPGSRPSAAGVRQSRRVLMPRQRPPTRR